MVSRRKYIAIQAISVNKKSLKLSDLTIKGASKRTNNIQRKKIIRIGMEKNYVENKKMIRKISESKVDSLEGFFYQQN